MITYTCILVGLYIYCRISHDIMTQAGESNRGILLCFRTFYKQKLIGMGFKFHNPTVFQ